MAEAGFKRGTQGETAADLLVRLGPTLKVDIGLKSRSPAGSGPDLARKQVKALIDTGAGGECIDDELARALRLPITDEGEISGVGGKHRAYIYTARVWVAALGRLLFQPLTGVKLLEAESFHAIILGRSFLRQHRLTYDGKTGEVQID